MNNPSVEQLNNTFSIQKDNHSVCFKTGKGAMPVVEINNEQATARISLQGAHILSWVPVDEDEVIWLSEDAKFTPGKAIRGGIPICWPWFGAHENNAAFPAHGFARTALWQVAETQALSAGETQITFTLDTHRPIANQFTQDGQNMWPQATVLEYRVIAAKNLTLELTTINRSEQPITIGQALHTYFNVGDVSNTVVFGLDGKDYLDKTDDLKRKTQSGPVAINTEVDRVYLYTVDDVVIDNKKRKITIKKQGSQSTVVWNPWKDVARKMGDMEKDGYLKMVCVESANAAEDTRTINSGESHKLRVIYELGE